MSDSEQGPTRARRAADDEADLDDIIEASDPVDGFIFDEDGFFEATEPHSSEGELPAGMGKRPSRWKGALAVLVALAVLIGGGWFAVNKMGDLWRAIGIGQQAKDYPGPGEEQVVVEIPVGSTVRDMAKILVEKDVIASQQPFIDAARAEPRSSSIQAASYQLMTKIPAQQALAMLLDPASRVQNQVTVREGLRNTEVARVLAEGTGIPAEDFLAVMASGEGLNLPGYVKGNSEGALFPDTYAYGPNSTAQSLLKQMATEFKQVIAELDFEAKAQAIGVDPYDALIVASIIEMETRDPKYGPDIAQVIYNRLKIGMKLRLDSTVIYANDKPGTVTTSDEERALPSPYNTYYVNGLPAGPIANPGKNSLKAAVSPTQGDYLYFVAVNPATGETKFASDDEGHAANVKEFQSWCRANPNTCTGG